MSKMLNPDQRIRGARMRQSFINTLIQLAETDKDLYLLTADMGFGLVEQFATRFPEQYINVGVAEQNMIGVATGLALEGKKVFCYSIGNFPAMRCLEQIQNDVCYHNLPVCIVSGGAGLWYGALGMTHHAVEDIAVMRCLPNMTVACPYDADEMVRTVKVFYKDSEPCYVRVCRTSNKALNTERTYKDHMVTILATGGKMVEMAADASRELSKSGIPVGVIAVSRIKPLARMALRQESWNTDLIITIEEHSKIGGLGSAVAEVLAGVKHHPPLVRMGTRDEYPDIAMSYDELLKYHHLDMDSIVKNVMGALDA